MHRLCMHCGARAILILGTGSRVCKICSMILRLGVAALLLFVVHGWADSPAPSRIHKVLHHLVDSRGRIALAPSLFERDAYQVHLRERPELIAGSRFDVHYKARRSDG